MYFHSPQDMMGRTVEIDGEPDLPNNGDVGVIVFVASNSMVTVRFADNTEATFRVGELYFS